MSPLGDISTLFDKTMAIHNMPGAKIRFVCGAQSAGVYVYAVHELRRCLEHGPSVVSGEGAGKARDLNFSVVSGEEIILYFLMNQSGHWRNSWHAWNHEIWLSSLDGEVLI